MTDYDRIPFAEPQFQAYNEGMIGGENKYDSNTQKILWYAFNMGKNWIGRIEFIDNKKQGVLF